MTFYDYLNDGWFWLSVLAVLVFYKITWFCVSHVFKCILDYIKEDAIEEYKKGKGE